jgi:hypothetical protein
LARACRKNAGGRSNKKDLAMKTSILQIKRKTKNEMGKRCYARYTNYEDQEKESHE